MVCLLQLAFSLHTMMLSNADRVQPLRTTHEFMSQIRPKPRQVERGTQRNGEDQV